MWNRRDFVKTLILSGAGLVAAQKGVFGKEVFALNSFKTAEEAWKTEYPRILARIKPPKFKKKDYLVTKYGAVGDGKTLNSEAFKKAIEECSKKGGGRVVVPAGEWLTGAIHLKSNVNLYVSKGATIKFSMNREDYLPIVHTRWEGMELMHLSPLIYAYEQTNIAVTGEGTLDGQGKAFFWKWHGNPRYGGNPDVISQKDARARLYKMMDDNVPLAKRIFGGEKDYLRPQFIQPYKCKNVLIEGVKIVDSPMWEVHPVLCENVIVRKLTIVTHGPNNDGCDPESCKDVLIEDCLFDTGDDCIAIKSGRNNDGRRINVPTENIIVRGCTMKDGHGGVTVGSEISGGVRNLFVENNLMDSPDLWNAFRVKNNASRGGLLENFYFRNVTIGEVSHAVITVDFNYEEGAKGQYTPVMRNFFVDNVTSRKSEYFMDAQGFLNAPIVNMQIKNSTFENVQKGAIAENMKEVSLENVKVNGKVIKDVSAIKVAPPKKS
ncbi:MAG TPA: glycoside hydrolase family 28 protein [Pyrinomonadaceae bacterium]|nr:glycoside hydrolase family 28 protein [Pyrinomonadaceae bacterium]